MQDPYNPYASPTTTEMHPVAAEWLGTPNESLQKVASGLGLIRNGLGLLIISVALYILGALVIGFGGLGREAMGMLLLAFAGAVVVAQIMNLVGSIRCLSAPPETEARGWIIASVVAEVLSMLIGVAALAGEKSQSSQGIQQLLGIIAFVTFIIFLRKLGLFIGRPDLAQRAVNLLIIWAILIGLLVVTIVGAVMAATANGRQAMGGADVAPGLAAGLAITLIVLLVVAIAKYLSLLADMKSAILHGR